MPKGTYKGVAKDEKEALEIARFGIANMGAEWAFLYLLEFDYKKAPTYAKAKELAAQFLTRGPQLEVNLNNDKLVLPTNTKLGAQLERLKTLSTNLGNAKTESDRLTVIEWVLGQKDFGAPSTYFDEAASLCARGGGDMVGKWQVNDKKKDIANGKGLSNDIKGFITKTWEPARKALEKAGYDMKPFEFKFS